MSTTFFTCCDKKYECFIPIFLHSTLYHNDVDAEICVESAEKINGNIKKSISIIRGMYPKQKIKIREGNFGSVVVGKKAYKIIPNVVRFLETPETINQYVYITDIDIICMQKDIPEIHIKNMEKSELGYDNIIRPGSERLTGLHFTKWGSYYPIPNYKELVLGGMLNHDEVFLYHLVKKKNPLPVELTDRPVHGIHASLNREKEEGWGIKRWKKEWIEYRGKQEFKNLMQYADLQIVEIVKKIDDYYNI